MAHNIFTDGVELLLTNSINPDDNQFTGATDDWYLVRDEDWNRDLHNELTHSAFKQWVLNNIDVECVQTIQYSAPLGAFTFRALSF